MENTDIIGGVSPLKARQSSRGGKRAGQATSRSKSRGGFAKSTGVRGGGGRNVGGYNVLTSFTPSAPWTPPASGGTTYIPNPVKPYSYDEDGKIKVGTEYRTLPGEKANKSKGTFDEVWDANENNFQDEWKDKGGKEAWKKQAQSEIDEGYYVGEGTDPRDQYRTWKQVNKNSAKTFSEWEDLVKNK